MNKHIEILGCSASGKTTLCNTLSSLGFNVVYEPYLENPFLLKFFNGESCAFELQTSFLLQHYNSIKTNNVKYNSICDFSFALDKMYASILLNEEEKCVYNYLYNYVTTKLGEPHYLVKLSCPDNVIVERMRKRNREYEQNINIDFLLKLNKLITDFCPTGNYIELDSSKIDISSAREIKKYLLKYI